MERAVVLNSDYSFLGLISWKRAIKLIVKDKVEVIKASDREICYGGGTCKIQLPLVIRLIKLVRYVYKNKVPFSRKNVYIRDKYTCQYCGAQSKLSIDHVMPKTRGGKNNFENCVACCIPCNIYKDKRTPREAGMVLKNAPYEPTIMEFLMIKMKTLGIDKVLKDLGVF